MSQKLNGKNKRKQSPNASVERPAKQPKPPNCSYVKDDSASEHDMASSSVRGAQIYDGLESDDEDKMLPLVAAAADTAEWQATIERVVRNVVSIHFCQTCSFDTDAACSSEATGFVVDAERGYILTNRHVVCAGPFWGYCIFDNHEEVSRALDAESVQTDAR